MMADDLLWEDSDFRVVSADMRELKECELCGRMTRTEWTRKAKKGVSRMSMWVCSTHKNEKRRVMSMFWDEDVANQDERRGGD